MRASRSQPTWITAFLDLPAPAFEPPSRSGARSRTRSCRRCVDRTAVPRDSAAALGRRAVPARRIGTGRSGVHLDLHDAHGRHARSGLARRVRVLCEHGDRWAAPGAGIGRAGTPRWSTRSAWTSRRTPSTPSVRVRWRSPAGSCDDLGALHAPAGSARRHAAAGVAATTRRGEWPGYRASGPGDHRPSGRGGPTPRARRPGRRCRSALDPPDRPGRSVLLHHRPRPGHRATAGLIMAPRRVVFAAGSLDRLSGVGERHLSWGRW